MKSLRWLPLTFLAGLHGFVMFTPYVAFVMAALMTSHRFRRRAVLVAVPAVPAA